jgi:hypothetical protein
MKKLLQTLLLTVLSLSIIGCGSDDGSNPTAPNSMAGATISFNPTIAFTSASAFTYENDDVDSAFVLGPISGTYTYTRDSDASATITLNGPGIGDVGVDTFTFQIRNFRGSATEITSFEIVADGEVLQVTVSAGVLAAGNPPRGGNSSLPDNEDVVAVTEMPADLIGTFVTTFAPAFGEPVNPISPYDEGDQVTFEITEDGELIFDGTTLDAPFFYFGNELEVIWFDGQFGYSASIAVGGGLNEINFAEGFDYFDQDTFTFIGQFREDSFDAGGSVGVVAPPSSVGSVGE